MNPNALPIELRHRPQWVCWASRKRDGKQTKVPLNPASGTFASTADAATWGTFDEALARATQNGISGIGFVFTSDDPYVGIDLDDCRDPDAVTLNEDAIEIVRHLRSYTEVSPSGTGVHIIARGTLPSGPRRRGMVEMYDEGRFFTMTGNHLLTTPEQICERSRVIRSVHATFVSTSGSTNSARLSTKQTRELTFTPQLDDEEIIQRAQSAANGEKFSALWNGDISGYDSHSEADMALCCLLAFWANRDASRVDRLFRQSGLVRPKWDEVHYADGATYGERTVERACVHVSEQYSE
ncbi:hypothetical protein [Haloprofundus salilacus]|uniref:phage NrS-1 polymerase family protein n=1 Tax=Haloprofundus salilacus TaxID=2876190 RepID=UPI001CCAB678|nr:hypothetical protein [Haloprofundus salilacus]